TDARRHSRRNFGDRQGRCNQFGAARRRHSRREASRSPRRSTKISRSADRTRPRPSRPRGCPGDSIQTHQPVRTARFEKEARVTIGILGGGQLGYMLALAGYPLGLHFKFFDPSPEAPVGRIAQRVTAEFSDESALEKFAAGLELVTYEFENVPLTAVRLLADRVPVFPPPQPLDAPQARLPHN